MYHYYIWQLPASNPKCFLPVDYNQIQLKDYVHVYTFLFERKKDLEDIFLMLNNVTPSDYHARDLSTSDLIIVRNTDVNELESWVVDITGFRKVEVV